MENFKKQYHDLEQRVHQELKNKIETSNYTSEHVDGKAIKIRFMDFVEMAIVSDTVVFVNRNGHHCNLYVAELENLIDLLDAEILMHARKSI